MGRRRVVLTSDCVPPSFCYGKGKSLSFLFTSTVVGRRVHPGLASYVGQSEVCLHQELQFWRVPKYTVHERALYFNSLFCFVFSHGSCLIPGHMPHAIENIFNRRAGRVQLYFFELRLVYISQTQGSVREIGTEKMQLAISAPAFLKERRKNGLLWHSQQ